MGGGPHVTRSNVLKDPISPQIAAHDTWSPPNWELQMGRFGFFPVSILSLLFNS